MSGPWEDFAVPAKAEAGPWADFAPAKPKAEASSVAGRIGTGLMDPVHGAAQLLTHFMPESVVKAGNEFNNWLVSKGLPLATIPAGGIDEMTRKREEEYQAGRDAAGSEGFDFARTAGNVASTLPLAGAIPLASRGAAALLPRALSVAAPKAAGITADVAGNIAGGAAMGALSPVTEGDFAEQKAGQVGVGAAVGAASPFITKTASRILNAPDSEAARLLAKKGVIMTPGQLLGGSFKTLEDTATSMPFLGNVVSAARHETTKSFNVAAVNDSLKHIGLKVPSGYDAGHKAIEWAAGKISDAYDKVLSRSYGELDNGLKGELNTLIANVNRSHMDPAQKANVARILQGEIFDRFSAGGRVAGETIKDMQSELRQLFRDSLTAKDYDARHAGAAFREADAAVTRMMQRINPNDAAELGRVDKAYASFLRPLVAAAKSGTREGIFTPAQLKRSATMLDASKWKKQSAMGKATGQEFAEAGQKVLPSFVADSGTPSRRNWWDPARVGTGIASGVVAAPFYSTPALWAMSQAARLQGTPTANMLARRMNQSANFLTPGYVAGANALQGP